MEKLTFGDKLKKQRIRKRLTQEELGELADITSAYVGQLERNERTPSLKRLKVLAEKLDVDLDYFISDNKTNELLGKSIIEECEELTDEKKQAVIEIIKVIKKYF